MKTTPDNLRRLAFILEKCVNPDAVTALRWAADDLEELQKRVVKLQKRLSDLKDALKALDEVYKRTM